MLTLGVGPCLETLVRWGTQHVDMIAVHVVPHPKGGFRSGVGGGR